MPKSRRTAVAPVMDAEKLYEKLKKEAYEAGFDVYCGEHLSSYSRNAKLKTARNAANKYAESLISWRIDNKKEELNMAKTSLLIATRKKADAEKEIADAERKIADAEAALEAIHLKADAAAKIIETDNNRDFFDSSDDDSDSDSATDAYSTYRWNEYLNKRYYHNCDQTRQQYWRVKYVSPKLRYVFIGEK